MKSLKDFEELNNIQELVEKNEWEIIEECFKNLCIRIAGEEFVVLINQLDFSNYKAELEVKLLEAIQIANDKGAKAIYYSYDQNRNWNAAFLICNDYTKGKDVEKPSDEDWASRWCREVKVECFEEAYDIYEMSKGFFSKKYIGVTLYIASIIMRELKDIIKKLDIGNLSICMHFMILKNDIAMFDDIVRLIEKL
ncbi:MAG: hypothetical protein GXY86_07120 [Firmicutes bacterium]|nr:hypothetical protein [Bacillota bacterium]